MASSEWILGKLLTDRVARLWDGFFKAVVTAPRLLLFKNHVNKRCQIYGLILSFMWSHELGLVNAYQSLPAQDILFYDSQSLEYLKYCLSTIHYTSF